MVSLVFQIQLRIAHCQLRIEKGRFLVGSCFSKIRKGWLCVGHAIRRFEKVDFALGMQFEESKRSTLRWASNSKTRKGRLCVGHAIRRLEKVDFALGKLFLIRNAQFAMRNWKWQNSNLSLELESLHFFSKIFRNNGIIVHCALPIAHLECIVHLNKYIHISEET